ncbi:DUF4222 domain-containing protein [Enterobacter sp. ASE]|uniref:DUF4222 domain-containing protein n=1 Tax=Enterobacter sp. ASE TaxID=2905968 RepID=UPI001E35F231|nr:DUF4222 domain-containing protein [Enterobacter sp. ASE]MCE3118706.1 DUF4222 domain-containing protein [Enterobacter sp. ASE]
MKKEQPEITLNSRWKDSRGGKITVKRVEFGRIAYVRDGYDCECVCSEYRFESDFTYLPEETKKCQAEAAAGARKKIAELRYSLPITFGSEGWDEELK